MSFNTQTWVPINVNNIVEAYGTHVNIPEGKVEISHTNRRALMAISMYGFTVLEGYGHAGKLNSQRGSLLYI